MSAAQPERRFPEIQPVPAAQRTDPELPWIPPPAPSAFVPPATPAASAPPGVSAFETDAPAAPDKAAFAPQTQALLKRLAELLRRPDAPTPFAFGLFAPPGAGKSSALNWLSREVAASGATVAVSLRAGDLAAEPERALAVALYRALSLRHAPLAQEAAHEGAHFGADPATIARAAHERLDALRKRLHAEKQALAQTETRRAALKEILLYDTPGSRVDAYARKMRSAVEPRLRRFGFKGDPLAVFKDLTRDVNESGGFVRRLLTGLRGLYAYQGQIRLLLWSAASFAVNKGIAWLALNKAAWLGVIASAGSFGVQTADFLQTRLDWLPMAAQGFALIALALLGLNIWRAFDFAHPLIHAAGLLDEDVAARRHEIDQSVAHHARNVEKLGTDADALAVKAAEAERRAAAAGGDKNPPLFLETDEAAQKRDVALGFLESLSGLVSRGAFSGAPQRIVVAVDGFEGAAAPAALLSRISGLLARPGLIAVFALDPQSFQAAPGALLRLIQLPLRLDAKETAEAVALAPLEAPLSPLETRLIGALAPLAGDSPRAQKRLRNLFRFLRPATGAPSGFVAALALFVAAETGATAEDRLALERALSDGAGDFAPHGSSALRDALADAVAIDGPISREDARRAAELARHVAAELA